MFEDLKKWWKEFHFHDWNTTNEKRWNVPDVALILPTEIKVGERYQKCSICQLERIEDITI